MVVHADLSRSVPNPLDVRNLSHRKFRELEPRTREKLFPAGVFKAFQTPRRMYRSHDDPPGPRSRTAISCRSADKHACAPAKIGSVPVFQVLRVPPRIAPPMPLV